jgi:hypothetical protein
MHSRLLLLAALVAAASGDICGEVSRQKLWEGECASGESDEATSGPSCSCKAGKPHGKGTLRDQGISIFHGTYVDGKKDGLGSLVYKSGMNYTGSYKADEWDGLGSLKTIAGHYNGEYSEGRQHGLGVVLNVKSEHYGGEWKDGKKHGLGAMEFVRSNKHIGNWENNKRLGCGVYYKSTAQILFGDMIPLQRMAGRWVHCVVKDECLWDFWCHCFLDGSMLYVDPVTGKVPPEDIKCADEAEELATQKQALAMEVAEKAKLQAGEAPMPPDMDFGTRTEEAKLAEPERLPPEEPSMNILEDPSVSFYLLAFMMSIQAIFPPKMQTRISILILILVFLSVLRMWGPHYSVHFFTGGRIKSHEADTLFAKLPELIRPSLYVPPPRKEEL